MQPLTLKYFYLNFCNYLENMQAKLIFSNLTRPAELISTFINKATLLKNLVPSQILFVFKNKRTLPDPGNIITTNPLEKID